MVRIQGAVAINRPIEEVFDSVADERNEPRYNPRATWEGLKDYLEVESRPSR